MKATSERTENCQVTLTIEVEPEEMEEAMDGAYRRLVNRVNIPGFRKGKAPRALLERHLGKDQLEAEALDHILPDLYQEAVAREEINAIGRPELEMVQNEPPIFKAVIPVPPEVELGDYHSISATAEHVEITEENIEQGIENLRRMHSTQEPVEREAQFDDIVTIDINATVGDETILDRNGDSFRLTAGADVPVPGFVEQIVGMSAGDEKEFTLSFPEDHANEELAGKECRFKVTVSEIKIEIMPELDDEFVKGLGQDIETVEQLRERLEQNMRAAAERDARTKLENEVVDSVTAISKVEFPSIFTEQEIDHIASEQMRRFGGMQLEDFLRYRGLTEEEFRNELRPAAEKRVTQSLVVNKVHEAENITVEEADIDAEIERVVQEAGDEGDQVRAMFDSPDARESMKGRLLTQKTMDRLIEIATSNAAKQSDEEDTGEEKEENEDISQETTEEETDGNEA
ncbi:MAG: trigger factor [Dehalococcoidia bacterium]